MAPLTKAINAEYLSASEDGTKIYRGDVDPEWTITAVPNGGYALALALQACIQYQASTNHHDPIHITAHFLQATSVGSFEVHVRTLKIGRGFSNILANLVQKGTTRITTHILFGVLAPDPNAPGLKLTLAPPSPYARRLPLYTHPSLATTVPLRSNWNFRNQVQCSQDNTLVANNRLDSPTRTNARTIGGGGVEWGAWFELTNRDEVIDTASLACLADIFQNLPALLPKSERAGLGVSWFPTMVMTVEFKFPIPTSSEYSKRTVGLYSSGKFMNDPQGRHESYVEVWTAPSGIGEGNVVEGWREKQVCLAIASQTALTLPIEVNKARARKDQAKL